MEAQVLTDTQTVHFTCKDKGGGEMEWPRNTLTIARKPAQTIHLQLQTRLLGASQRYYTCAKEKNKGI